MENIDADIKFNARFFHSQAVQRSVTDCPICIMPLTDQGLYRKNSSSRPTVLLSCSHVFHATCLQAFEEFSFEKHRVCPVCRSSYHKKIMLRPYKGNSFTQEDHRLYEINCITWRGRLEQFLCVKLFYSKSRT